MKAGQTNIELGATVKLTGLTSNDKIYNGLIGRATHPKNTGCTKKGWITVELNQYTVYGYNINVKEK